MDNNGNNGNNGNKQPPKKRKKVTKEVLRRRQLVALAVIALLVLIVIVLIAKACTKITAKEPSPSSSVTTTLPPVQTTVPIVPPAEAVEVTTVSKVTVPQEFAVTETTTTPAVSPDPDLSSQVELSKREMYLVPGDIDLSYIESYPDGSDNTNEIWETTDSSVAVVDKDGYVTAIAPGECYIVLKFSNNPAVEVQIKVTVAEGSANYDDSDYSYSDYDYSGDDSQSYNDYGSYDNSYDDESYGYEQQSNSDIVNYENIKAL